MRVAQVHWAYAPTTGGVESHLVDIASSLSARGHAVAVLTGEPEPTPTPGVTLLMCRALNVDPTNSPSSGSMRLALEELDTLFTDFRPDVVHGHNLHHFSPFPALAIDRLARKHRYRVVHTFHETWPDVLADNPVYRRWSHNFTGSEFIASQCERMIGYRPSVMPFGVDANLFTCGDAPFSRPLHPVILHPARMLPWKGVHVSVLMLDHLRDLNVRLLITDTPRIIDAHAEWFEYRQYVRDLIDSLDLRERVEFVDCPYGAMPAMYNTADVVVYPTEGDEPFGLAPLEAMSCGRPVVVTNSGGMRETVQNGVSGWLVDRGDPTALAERVRLLIEQPDRAVSMGEAGRQQVLSRYNLHSYIDALEDVYLMGSSM